MLKASDVKQKRPWQWKGGKNEMQKRYKEKNPWYVSYNKAKSRCLKSGNYYHRGIKFLMTMDDFEFLWFRDKAYDLERPSIDRIDGNGNYELSNCRFMELAENKKRMRNTTLFIINNWDKSKTLKESSVIFNMTYRGIQKLSLIHNLDYKRNKYASKVRPLIQSFNAGQLLRVKCQ